MVADSLRGKKIILGVCGGAATYKSLMLLRLLTDLGAIVRVVLTESAKQFITPLAFQSLSQESVHSTLWDLEQERAMGHIQLAKWADLILIAPLSANTMAKITHGIADDLLTTLILVTKAPVLLCPAMNQAMWQNQATVDNAMRLQSRGYQFIGPDSGKQACGDEGPGRLVEPELIVQVCRMLNVSQKLKGEQILITAGPTVEAIDPVRVISNHSSGKMGYALANAAFMAGAEVTVVSGPCDLMLLPGITKIDVKSANEMHEAVMNSVSSATIFMGVAAVCDYKAAEIANHKIKKQTEMTLQLVKNPDILAEVGQYSHLKCILGFAAETDALEDNARTKLHAKNCDLIVANMVGNDLGFYAEHNEGIVFYKNGESFSFAKQNKLDLAVTLVQKISDYVRMKHV